MAKAYVETTVLTDALLKPGIRSASAKSAINSFKESLLPVYAIKEMKAGPLHHYAWFHGKLVTTGSWEKTLGQLRKMAATPRTRWVSTAVEALEAAAHKNRRVTVGDLAKKYGPLATEDVVLCDRYRMTLRSIVMRAWKTRRTLTTSVVHGLGCYQETEITEDRGLLDLGETNCQPKDECALASALKDDPEALKKLRQVVEEQRPKPENIKRAQVLKDLIRLPGERLTAKQCRQLGDAVFAFFCPADASILTTNIQDIRPLAEALGKKTQHPDETV